MHARRSDLPVERLGETYEVRLAEWGDCMAYFERMRAGGDLGAYYDRCDCPHLGFVFRGKVRFVYTDGSDEIVSAGEMYYVSAGHTFEVLEDAETVEFSPTWLYREHMSKIATNMPATDAG